MELNSLWANRSAVVKPSFAKLLAMRKICLCLFLLSLLSACGQSWNDPYPAADGGRNILYTAFTDRPKHLDPAQSYTEDEIAFTAQVYEPPLQYHYLKRPYELIASTLEQVPVPRFYAADGRELPADAAVELIAESVYELKLKRGIRFQPHPAFALDSHGQPLFIGKNLADGRQTIADFPQVDSRELTADDYIYQIKRLAHPRLHSPIWIAIPGGFGLKANTRSFFTGWPCRFLPRCPAKPIAFLPNRAWLPKT